MADVVKCNVYLREGTDFGGMNEVYAEAFSNNKPANHGSGQVRQYRDLRRGRCIAYSPRK
jgi:enamine deaminase RidA (YjgF/YER057c/UK114 family)